MARKMKDRVLALFVGLITIASAIVLIPSVSAGKLTPGPDATQQWSQDQFMAVADDMLQDENMSGHGMDGGQPMSFNVSTGDVYASYGYGGQAALFIYYDSNDTWINLGAVNNTSQIRHVKEAADGSIIATLTGDRHIMRSADKGASWQNVWNMTRGGDCWNIETRGRLVYVAEYGKSTETSHNSIWYSTDCGRPGTWAELYGGDTFNFTSTANHWHDGWLDPFTNDMYFVGGDANDCILKSTDGTHFYRWGGFTDGACAISGDQNNIYIWEDGAPWAIHTYNRTTQEFRYEAPVTNTSGAFYYGITGHYGVSYGRSVTEGDAARSGHIYGTVDGQRLFVIANQTTIYEPSAGVIGPVYSPTERDWFIWYGDNVPEPWYMAFPHRFRDLTREEGLALQWQRHNETASDLITYKENGLSYDGQKRMVSYSQEVSTSTVLKVTGYNASNLMEGGDGFENVPDLNQTYPYDGYWGGTNSDNLTKKITAERAHSGTYSLKIQTFNNTGFNGGARYVNIVPGLGTHLDMVASHYISIDQQGIDYWDGSFAVSSLVTVLYADYSGDSFNCNGGIGSNFYTLTGNMSQNQWARSWTAIHTDSEKAIIWLIFDISIDGVGSVYLDDFMIEPGTMLTPYIPYAATTNWSENVTVQTNGQTFDFGDLYAGQTVSRTIGTISGNLRMDWAIDGSRVVNWTLTGTRMATAYNCLIQNRSGVINAYAAYTGAAIEVEYALWLDPGSFKLGTDTPQTLSVTTGTSYVNLTVQDWASTLWEWTGNLTSVWDSETEYTLMGLSELRQYWVTVTGPAYDDGPGEWRFHTQGESSMSFTVEGNATISIDIVTYDRTTANWAGPFTVIGFSIVVVAAILSACGLWVYLKQIKEGW